MTKVRNNEIVARREAMLARINNRELCWRKFTRVQAQNERRRYIRQGRICAGENSIRYPSDL